VTVLTVNQGDTVTLTIAVVSPTNQPVNLTGSTLEFVVKAHASDAVAIISKTSAPGGGITIAAGAGGTATVALAPTDTEPGPTGAFVWELEGTDTGGNITTLASGSFLIMETLV
jgi:hypothetical protein